MNAVVKQAATPLQLAVNFALESQRIAQLRAQAAFGQVALDSKRPRAWCEYGFPEHVSFELFFQSFKRTGVAHGAVNKIIDACWSTSPWVIEGDPDENDEDETTWEKATKKILSPRLWAWLKEADRRRLVGKFSAVIIHVADSKKLDQPVTRKLSAITKLTPCWASSLKVKEFDRNENSETYGQPVMWQYMEAGIGGSGNRTVEIHPDRIFIFGDITDSAIGFLEPAINNFISLEKVEGGSGESFLKNAARQLGISFDKEVDLGAIATTYGVKLEDLHAKFNDAARDMNHGLDTLLITQGATTTPLTSTVSDPTPTYNINLQSIACALDIPTKILVGMQTGERASTEDQKYFNKRCQSRRDSQLRFELEDFVKHLFRIGVLTTVDPMSVMWDDITEPNQADNLANAKLMADINNASLGTGERVFESSEVREAAGFEPDTALTPLPEPEPVKTTKPAGTGATQ